MLLLSSGGEESGGCSFSNDQCVNWMVSFGLSGRPVRPRFSRVSYSSTCVRRPYTVLDQST